MEERKCKREKGCKWRNKMWKWYKWGKHENWKLRKKCNDQWIFLKLEVIRLNSLLQQLLIWVTQVNNNLDQGYIFMKMSRFGYSEVKNKFGQHIVLHFQGENSSREQYNFLWNPLFSSGFWEVVSASGVGFTLSDRGLWFVASCRHQLKWVSMSLLPSMIWRPFIPYQGGFLG